MLAIFIFMASIPRYMTTEKPDKESPSDFDTEIAEKSPSVAAEDENTEIACPDSARPESNIAGSAIEDLAEVIAGNDAGLSVADRQSAATTVVDLTLEDRLCVAEAVSTLAAGLSDPASEAVALRALVPIVKEHPDAIDPVLDAVGERLVDQPLLIRRHAIRIVAERADSDPAAVTRLVSQLSEMVIAPERVDAGNREHPSYPRPRSQNRTVVNDWLGQQAAAVLCDVASVKPESVVPELNRLGSVIDPNNVRNTHLRELITEVIRIVATTLPEASAELLPLLVELLKDETASTTARADGAAALAALAETRLKQTTDRAEAAIPALETLLMNEDPGVRARVGSLLPYIAQRHPEAAAPLTSLLIDCLEDELTPIRASVVWTLGYIDTKTARNALREVAGADPDPSLRTLATDRLYAEADD